MDKTELRQTLKQARLDLSEKERADLSSKISEKLKGITDWSSVNFIHVYEPIDRLGEVDTSSFYTEIKQLNPKMKIYTSKKISDKWRITSVGGESLSELPHFDYIIVPMLGFDETLHRIGYGGGYYDRLLASQPGAQKIGVCFDQGRHDSLPTEPHDIALNQIITEKTIYSTP